MATRDIKTPVRTFQTKNCSIALLNGDCVRILKDSVESGSIDCVVTSPPYNLGISYSSYNDNISRSDYLDWLGEWAVALKEAMSDGASLFLNVGSKPTDPAVPFEALEVMRRYFRLQNTIHWIKSVAISKEDAGNYPQITGGVSVGHYKPINSPRFINDCHEYIFHLTKSGDVLLDRLAVGVPYQDKSNVARWKSAGQDVRCRGNTWFIPYKTIQNRSSERPHPATFPIKLPEMCMRLHGVEKIRLACDPFMGLGHSALAAIRLQVNFVGMEIDGEYFEESMRAVTEATSP